MTESYRCWAEVDLNALRDNLAKIRQLAGPTSRILTVVKADAYGHGIRQIAAVLMHSGTDVFGVASLAEARAVRSVGQGWPILMLGACLPGEVDTAIEESVMPTLSNLQEAERFSRAAVRQGRQVIAHLKVDTGMGRLGAPPAEVIPLIQAMDSLPGLVVRGLYTHFSSVEDDAGFTAAQRERFAASLRELTERGRRFEWVHANNSGGLLLEPPQPGNMVRAGLLVYGIVPPGSRSRGSDEMRPRFSPALTWKCRVSQVREVPAGTPISYGRTFVTQERMRLAVLAVGYGDGLLRSASNRAAVLVRGRRCRVVGRVTMDQTVVDATGLPLVEPGDEAVLLGRQGQEEITANELAEWCQTIPWEILTNITYRVPRIYRGSHAA